MAEICYLPKRFNDEHEYVISIARDICEDFASQGYDLTLRQLYYQFVKSDQFPDHWTWKQVGQKWVRDPNGTKNADPNYKKLGTIITDARLAGELTIDDGRIVDADDHVDEDGDVIAKVKERKP